MLLTPLDQSITVRRALLLGPYMTNGWSAEQGDER